MAATWHSVELKVFYNILGWIAFVSWSLTMYPQAILNFRRKSVVGLNFDFILLNLIKQMAYMIYNASVLFSKTVQKQYYDKFGFDEMLPVAQSDLAFSIHSALTSILVMFQIGIYERGGQKFSKTSLCLICLILLAAAICVFIAIPRHSWFWLVSCFNTIQVVMTIIKYVPQVLFNFQRKCTSGFSVGNVMLDFLGGIANNVQMVLQSIDQSSFENFYGNLGKTLLIMVTIFFDTILLIQHYLLYPTKKISPAPTPTPAPTPNSIVANVELPRRGTEEC